MGTKKIILFILIIILGCGKNEHQKIIFDNKNKTISILNNDFVIDSVSIQKFGNTLYSCSLINKSFGENKIILTKNNLGYKIYVNELSSLNCNDKSLNLLIIIRKKGKRTKVTKEVATNFETNIDIQVKDYKYEPCSNKIDTLKTDVSFK